MAEMEFKRREDFLKRILEEDKALAEKDEQYAEYLAKLNTLVKETDSLYSTQIEITTEKREELLKLYKDLYNTGNKYIVNPKNPNAQKRRNIINQINRYIDRDHNAINGMDAEKPGSIYNVINDGRRVKLDITGKTGTVLGGAMNARYAVKIKSGKKGFFTEKATTAFTKQWLDIIEKYKDKLSEEHYNGLVKFAHDYKKKLRFGEDIGKDGEHFSNEALDNHIINKLEKTVGLKIKKQDSIEVTGENKVLCDMVKEMEKVTKAQSFAYWMEMEEESRIDKRNIAVYEVAKFLGCPEVIARATPMTVIKDGKEIKGTFMENAEGLDLSNMSDETIENLDMKKLFTPEFFRQLNQMTIVDYICGNVDRHHLNLIFKFDEKNGGISVGATGIDNDTSFPLDDVKKLGLYSPEKTVYIDADIAEMVKSMDKDMLKTIVRGCDLSDAQIDMAWGRVKELQKAIKDKKLEILDKDGWQKKKRNATEVEKDMMRNVANHLKQKKFVVQFKKSREDVFADKKKIDFIEGTDISEKENLRMSLRSTFNMADKMRDTDVFYVGSSEFKKMRDALYDMEKVAKSFVEDIKNDTNVNAARIDEYKEAVKKFIKASDEYIDCKKLEPLTSHGVKRLETAKALEEKAWEIADSLGIKMEKEKDTEIKPQEAEQEIEI